MKLIKGGTLCIFFIYKIIFLIYFYAHDSCKVQSKIGSPIIRDFLFSLSCLKAHEPVNYQALLRGPWILKPDQQHDHEKRLQDTLVLFTFSISLYYVSI